MRFSLHEVLIAILVLSLTVAVTGCGDDATSPGESGDRDTDGLKIPKVAFLLPEHYQSPDGLTLGPDGCIYLSMNNAGEGFGFAHPAKIVRITKDDKMEEVTGLPPHPETKVASPLGLGFASDGNLYVSDNQSFATDKPGRSRLLRVRMKDGKAEGVDVVALGFNKANGLACKDDAVFVCETGLSDAEPLPSGVYRFELSELDPADPVTVTGKGDPHLILELTTKNPEHAVGANGLCFDSKGNLYVCNFGDREVWKARLDDSGEVASFAVLAKDGGLLSTDGLHTDENDDLWVADFLGNAVARIDSTTGKVTLVAKNGQVDGAEGGLDAPSECIRRGNKVYVSNIDITYGPNQYDPVQTVSVIELDG